MKVERVTPPAPVEYHFVCNYDEVIAIRMALYACDRYKEAVRREEWSRMADQISEVAR